MKIDSAQRKSIQTLATELLELMQRDPWKMLGKETKIPVKNLNRSRRSKIDPDEVYRILEDSECFGEFLARTVEFGVSREELQDVWRTRWMFYEGDPGYPAKFINEEQENICENH